MFFSGAAGTGKTYLVNHMVNALRVKHKKNVAVTSSTGITAFNLGGTTVHSWAGVGTGETSLEEIIKSLSLPDARATKQRWLTTDVLVLDEGSFPFSWSAHGSGSRLTILFYLIVALDKVSMIDATLFDKLDAVGRDIRKIDAPFGGIQLLMYVPSARPFVHSPLSTSLTTRSTQHGRFLPTSSSLSRHPNEIRVPGERMVESGRFGGQADADLSTARPDLDLPLEQGPRGHARSGHR